MALRFPRILAALAAAATGLALATLVGAPLVGSLLALLAGAAAVALGRPAANRAPSSSASPPAQAVQPSLPGADELLRAVDEPLLLVRDRKVVLANAAARAVLGDHIEGVDVRLAIRHPAAAERLAQRQAGEPSEAVVRTELVGLGDRERRWVMTASLLESGARLVHLSDRSESHASEQMRTDFVANASHELRTPLATLLGFLETLQEREASEDRAIRSRFLRIMFDEAKRMHRLVDDLISLSRIEAERFSLPRESVSLLSLVEEVQASCGAMIEEKQSAIITERAEVDPVVLGDRSQLLQLLRNLVVNALKYGRPGAPVTIRFGGAGPDMLRMSVIDRGEGIAPEHLPRLTERFYRADPSRSRAMGGTGLGLAIVKHIVGRHRGRLDIRSQVGEGTAVHVYLPRAPGSPEPLSSKSHGTVTEVTPDLASDASGPDGGLHGG